MTRKFKIGQLAVIVPDKDGIVTNDICEYKYDDHYHTRIVRIILYDYIGDIKYVTEDEYKNYGFVEEKYLKPYATNWRERFLK
jgi:hypothetical protein